MNCFFITILFLLNFTEAFIVGGCIGPKSVLERYLSDKQRMELRKMVHNNFDGTNSEKILEIANRFVFGHITETQWHTIVPELAEYQSKKHECSLYAQLLPKTLYQQLLKSVLRASEMGASKYDVKRLVDDYVERLSKAGVLPDVVEEQTRNLNMNMNMNMVPERNSDGYRSMPPKRPKQPPLMKKMSVHPTLIATEKNNNNNNKHSNSNSNNNYPDIPMFPIARPTPYELNQFGGPPRSRSNNNNQRSSPQRFNNQMHECDYYAGPCATSF